MNMLKMCLNPKVLMGLAFVAVGIYVVAPGLLVAALPILLLAACPLSMLLMGGMMMRGDRSGESAPPAATDEDSRSYYCPMHRDVVTSAAGSCPKCGMRLTPKPGVSSGQSGAKPEDEVARLRAEVESLRAHIDENVGTSARASRREGSR